jgi:superfamily II DNA helicase RecQ
MSIQYAFYIVPIKRNNGEDPELNSFLRSTKIIHIHREFINQGENSYWSFAVEYLHANKQEERGSKSKVDYKEILSPEDFILYCKLRDWRKKASEEEAIPVYNIFTNEQLAKIAAKRVMSKSDLQSVEGVGESKVKKYANSVISLIDSSMNANKQTEKSEKQNENV